MDQSAIGNGILEEAFEFDKGFVRITETPGLGINVNEAALRKWQV